MYIVPMVFVCCCRYSDRELFMPVIQRSESERIMRITPK